MKVFLDSNVFLYAAGGPHPLRESCRAVLHRLATGELAATTSTEVVQEVVHVVARRGGRPEALRLGRAIIAMFPDLLPVASAVVTAACDLMEQDPDLTTRDAVHAATMLTNHLDTIISADAHFDAVRGLRRIDPATA